MIQLLLNIFRSHHKSNSCIFETKKYGQTWPASSTAKCYLCLNILNRKMFVYNLRGLLKYDLGRDVPLRLEK